MLSKRLLLPLVCLLVCSSVYAQVPYTFKDGTAAKADEVNADFSALEDQIGQLQQQISTLTGVSSTSILGTYDIFKLGVKLADNSNGNYDIADSSFSGTVVFNSGGTGTFTSSEGNTTLSVNNDTTNGTTGFHFQVDGPSSNSGPFTWSLTGNQVTVSPSGGSPITFAFNGGVAVGVDTSDGRDLYVVVKR